MPRARLSPLAVVYAGAVAVCSLVAAGGLDRMPGAGLTDTNQVAFAVGWLYADNLRSGLAVTDASLLVDADGASLWAVFGNPGAALLLAPAHALLDPAPAHAAGLIAVLVANVLAMSALGSRRGHALLGAGLGASTWIVSLLASGRVADALLAPAALAWCTERRWLRWALLAVGLMLAPLPTAVVAGAYGGASFFLLSLAVMLSRPFASGLSPVMAEGVQALGVGDWAWPLAHTTPSLALPLLLLPGLCLVARGSPLTLGVAVAGLLAASDPPAVRGWDLDWLPMALGPNTRVDFFGIHVASVAVVVPAGLAAFSIALLKQPIPGVLTRTLTTAVLLMEPLVGMLSGRVPLLSPDPWPVPPALVALGEAPRSIHISQEPVNVLRAGAIGFLPFHRQTTTGLPEITLLPMDRPRHPPPIDQSAVVAWNPTSADATLSCARRGSPDVMEPGLMIWFKH